MLNGATMLVRIAFSTRLLYRCRCVSGGDTARESPRVGVVDGGKLIFKTERVSSSYSLNDDMDEMFCGEFDWVLLSVSSWMWESV